TETGITATPVTASCACANGSRSCEKTSPSIRSASCPCRARIESGSFFRGHRRSSTPRAYGDNLWPMATEQVVEQQHEDPSAYAGVLRFYELAKRAEWQVRDLPWGEIPPIPETTGAPQKVARRRDMWRSVITQQLQADELACEMA